jgi:hypothetical protein
LVEQKARISQVCYQWNMIWSFIIATKPKVLEVGNVVVC